MPHENISTLKFRIRSRELPVYRERVSRIRNERRNCFPTKTVGPPKSVLPMVLGRCDAHALHFVKERGAFQAESGGRAPRPAEPPIRALAGNEDLPPDFVLQRGIGNLRRRRLALLKWCRFEDSVIGKNY